jgi:hypothetical protein
MSGKEGRVDGEFLFAKVRVPSGHTKRASLALSEIFGFSGFLGGT